MWVVLSCDEFGWMRERCFTITRMQVLERDGRLDGQRCSRGPKTEMFSVWSGLPTRKYFFKRNFQKKSEFNLVKNLNKFRKSSHPPTKWNNLIVFLLFAPFLDSLSCVDLCEMCWVALLVFGCVSYVDLYELCCVAWIVLNEVYQDTLGAGLCELFWVWLCALLGCESQLGIRALDRSASRNFSLAPNLLFTHCSFTSGEVIPEQIPPQTSSQTGATLTVFFIKDARDEAPLTTVFKLVQYLLYSTWTWGKRKISSNNILRAGLGDGDHHLVLLLQLKSWSWASRILCLSTSSSPATAAATAPRTIPVTRVSDMMVGAVNLIL